MWFFKLALWFFCWDRWTVLNNHCVYQSLSRVWLFVTPWTQHARPPCPSPTPGAYSNSCPLSRWCHPTISSSIVPFSCLQSFPASGSFQMSQFFASSGRSIGVSASTSVFPMNIQDWFPLGWTSWISLQSKELSRVFNASVLAAAKSLQLCPTLSQCTIIKPATGRQYNAEIRRRSCPLVRCALSRLLYCELLNQYKLQRTSELGDTKIILWLFLKTTF